MGAKVAPEATKVHLLARRLRVLERGPGLPGLRRGEVGRVLKLRGYDIVIET